MIAGLEWIGGRARWILALGAVAALFLQDLAELLRPALPVFVAAMYALAMVRIDLAALLRRSLRPRRLAMLVALCAALMIGTPLVVASLAKVLSLPTAFAAAMIYIAAAPPLGSSAALCLLLGLDAALALELTVLGSILAPIFGPFVTTLLLGEAAPIDALALSIRLGTIIAAGLAMAVVLRRILGPEVIARRPQVFDGIGAIAMLATIVPIFDGVTAQLVGTPFRAAAVLVLVFVLNIGVQFAVRAGLEGRGTKDQSGALALVWGNRNAALFLAALPQTPVLTLFVALYQFPMYMTPLLMKRRYERDGRRGRD